MASKRSSELQRVFGAIALCAWWAAANAVTVHAWVDRDGVTHFSDVAPGSDVSAAREIHFDDITPRPHGGSPSDDYYSIARQWERMRAERDASAAARLDRELVKAQLTLASTPDLPPDPNAYVDIYPRFRSSYGIFSGYRHRGYGRGNRMPRGMISPFNKNIDMPVSTVALASPMRVRLGNFSEQHRVSHGR